MKVKKMLSIIIPTYNSVKIISNTLDTLINQSSPDFELIFVDDGSTDKTICFISEKLINTEIKFKLIKNPDKGASQARNYGISMACGDKILFLDHDDLLLNHAVSQITNSFTSDNDILIFDYYTSLNNKYSIVNNFKTNQIYNGLSLFKSKILKEPNAPLIWISNIVYSKSFLKAYNLNYNSSYQFASDVELAYKSLFHASSVRIIPDLLIVYNISDGSMNNSFNFRRFDAFYNILSIKDLMDSELKSMDNYNELKTKLTNQMLNGFIYNYTYLYFRSSNYKKLSIGEIIKFNMYVYEYYPYIFDDCKLQFYSNLNYIYKLNPFNVLFQFLFIYFPFIFVHIAEFKLRTLRELS